MTEHPEYVNCHCGCGTELYPDSYDDRACIVVDLGPCEHSWDPQYEYWCVSCHESDGEVAA